MELIEIDYRSPKQEEFKIGDRVKIYDLKYKNHSYGDRLGSVTKVSTFIGVLLDEAVVGSREWHFKPGAIDRV